MSRETTSFAPVLTHLMIGAVGALAAIPVPGVTPWLVFGVTGSIILMLSVLFSSYLRLRANNGLAIIENAVVTGEKPAGSSEFHRAASNIVTHVSRLATVAAKGREQSREVEELLSAFDRRGSRGKSNPSRELTLLLKSLGRAAQHVIERISTTGAEMETVASELRAATESQDKSVKAAAAQVDELAESLEQVNGSVNDAKTQDSLTTEVAETISSQLVAFQRQLEHLRHCIVNSEKKSQMLHDQTVEITSLMQTINEYSSKTDTMALNASIESVRAGEHGRGFAAAADEIRKLTGIISDSSRNVLDRLQHVSASVDETAGLCSQGHATVEQQLAAARELTESMSGIRLSRNQSREHLDQILQTADGQLQNVSAMAQILEDIFMAAGDVTARVDVQSSKRMELTQALQELGNLLGPLMGQAAMEVSPHPAQQGVPAAVAEGEALTATPVPI